MTDLVKQTAPLIWSAIQSSQHILLHCHPSPDPDTYGSALALYHLLKSLGKHATVIAGDSAKPPEFACLPGFIEVLPLSFGEVNLNEFDTFLICDSSNYDQISSKLKINFPASLNTVVIDHHRSNVGYGKLNLVDTNYPATCQIIFDLINAWQVKLTPEIAICLFSGIFTDTGGFIYPPSNCDTFLAGAELVKVCPNYYETIFALENSNTASRLKYKGLAFSNINLYFNSQVAISEVNNLLLTSKGLKREDAQKSEVSSELISVTGWDIGICLWEPDPGETHASFRTRNSQKYDLSQLAVRLGGGGHPAAAGTRMKLPFLQAKDLLLSTLAQVYPGLGKP